LTAPQDSIDSDTLVRELERKGIQQLRSGDYSNAEKIFLEEYKMLLRLQDRTGRRIHKGAPLYNLGLSTLFQDKADDGLKYILFAYVEDVISSGQRSAADNLPASVALRSLCCVSVDDLRHLEDFVLERKTELPLSSPEEIYSRAVSVIDPIRSKFEQLKFIYKLEIEAQKNLSSGDYGRAGKVYSSWYRTLIAHQQTTNTRLHKGHPLHNIGVSLSLQGNFKEAFRYFLLAYVEDAISAYKIGDAENLPAFITLRDGFRTDSHLLRRIEALVFEKKKEKKANADPAEILSEFGSKVSQEQTRLSESFQEIIESKKKRETELFSRFIKDEVLGNQFIVLRRWNSATPRYPLVSKKSEEEEGSIGGGYYLCWQGKGIVIDPEYDFLALFFQEFGLNHIDVIIATHAHDDHTQDIETIFSLIHKMNKRLDQKKTLEFFGSEGVKIKYSRLIEVTRTKATDLIPGIDLDLNEYNAKLKAVRTDHNEEPWMKSNTGVGVILELKSPTSGDLFRIGLTGDTRYRDGMEAEFENVDLLVVHLGTIGESKSEHLQEEGCTRIIREVRPRLAIVSEFGEELLGRRCQICDRIRTFVNPPERPDLEIPILPGDVMLKVNLPSLDVYCENTGRYKECKRVVAVELRGRIHYLDKDEL